MEKPRALTLADDAPETPLEINRFADGTVVAVIVEMDTGQVDVHLCVAPSDYLVSILEIALATVKESLGSAREWEKQPS